MKKQIIVELRGVEFVNKGAELMLFAILEYLRNQLADNVTFVMEKSYRVPVAKLRENGIYRKFNSRKFKINWEIIANIVPTAILRKSGFVLPGDIDVVLDGSGFAFGDQWGREYAYQRLGRYIRRWKRENKKVILLPQAFGPFSTVSLKSEMIKILESANLVFAREEQSYRYLKELSLVDNIRLAPDFTNLIKGIIPVDFNNKAHDVAIIPNYKMIEKHASEQVYMFFLRNAVKEVQAQGLIPYFLIHEGERDLKIAKRAVSMLDKPIAIVYYPHALMVKGVISTARFIICSRFHGVVSALSQGVPCLATSWSHKYEMLAKEYNFSAGIINDLADIHELKAKIRKLADPAQRKLISDELIRNGNIQKKRAEEMWREVLNSIK